MYYAPLTFAGQLEHIALTASHRVWRCELAVCVQPEFAHNARMSTQEALPPNYGKLDAALRSIGYSFEVAVADIIDNSIDAKADTVLVRLITRNDSYLDLVVWDNGEGMDAATLKEAMRFGSDVSKDIARLGKFGLGLKLASLSQARDVTVVSSRNGKLSGRAWLESGIESGFVSTIYERQECKNFLSMIGKDIQLTKSGTLVWWSRLYRVGHNHAQPEAHAQKLMRRLQSHLSLSFHRFLSGRAQRTKITLDIYDQRSGRPGLPYDVDALDPFGYPQSGRAGYPATMKAGNGYQDRIKIKAHIWPPNSTSPEYKLPGGTNARQGFYFYRNNRLIQGGGWNGMREAEPHASLARLEIDLAPETDIDVSLDVKKVEIQLPPTVAHAIENARTASGIDLRKYLSMADEAYRKRQITTGELPLIPAQGLPADLIDFLRSELRIKATSRQRDLKIKWQDLDKREFFAIDRDSDALYINRLYRKALLRGVGASSADLPVIKCMLFLLLKDALLSERTGAKQRERIEQINRILVRAAQFERAQ